MKKKSFLSGIGAKLALAAVALTTVVFTSCEEESFNVEPIEQVPASATILATVYDQTTGEVLGTQSSTISAGENGAIAAQTVTVACPFSSAEYLPVASIEVSVPAVAKGQMILIPVTFYAQKIGSAAQNVSTSKDEETIEKVDAKKADSSQEYVGTGKPQEVEYNAWVGSQILNKTEIYAYIETLVNNSRAMSNENVITVLKALVDTYDNMKQETIKTTVTIPAGDTFVFNPVTSMTEYVMSIRATVDNATYTIPNVKVKEAGTTDAGLEILSHSHDHGHGDSGNAGGGAGGK